MQTENCLAQLSRLSASWHFGQFDAIEMRTMPGGMRTYTRCRFSTLMAHAAILTDGFPVFLIKVARAFFSFQWQIRQPHGCVVVDPWLR